jgi:hypothetical protein
MGSLTYSSDSTNGSSQHNREFSPPSKHPSEHFASPLFPWGTPTPCKSNTETSHSYSKTKFPKQPSPSSMTSQSKGPLRATKLRMVVSKPSPKPLKSAVSYGDTYRKPIESGNISNMLVAPFLVSSHEYVYPKLSSLATYAHTKVVYQTQCESRRSSTGHPAKQSVKSGEFLEQ